MRQQSMMRWRWGAMALVLLVSVQQSHAAETLTDAMSRAYMTNPTLRADRARQRATDELVPQAKSGWRPSIDNQYVGTTSNTRTNRYSETEHDKRTTGNMSISLSQPVFRGFRTINSVGQAKAQVRAGREDLLTTEQDVLFQSVQDYMNVIASRQIVELRKRDVGFLELQLKASMERFNVGDVTRTDVAQARSSLANSQAQLARAIKDLEVAVAAYLKTMGQRPGKLIYPTIAPLPPSLDSAIALSQDINPRILSAAYQQVAAKFNIGVARSGLLPQVSIQTSGQITGFQGQHRNPVKNSRELTLQGVVSFPLYDAGYSYSAVRQAKQVESQRRIQVIETARDVRESVTDAWATYIAATRAIAANKVSVEAARLALEGLKQEFMVGSRTTQDVLIGESALVSAEINLIISQTDQIVSSYQILASIGKLTWDHLDLPTDYYDPKENYRRVKNKWIGTGVKTVE